jgi:hypothetical protein
VTASVGTVSFAMPTRRRTEDTTEETQAVADTTVPDDEESEEETVTTDPANGGNQMTMEERKAKLEKLRQKMACLFLLCGLSQ